ncbi:NADH:flavin oxidoreductase/NADH oxidase [Desulfovibrio legallii]|uniref:2,4-dienoyl-CoA reductase n=1 Tax=Desulfovibrio legallii TaxID=571438 RepID=A0A1G7HYL8_9BACT|nr:NADH:flavin oxidoreductase/NADH oxidase [Desulfovibrio legallii]SDF05199.1 2,4-dienoyl-CoA reductase [Desulfovibrio legallii]
MNPLFTPIAIDGLTLANRIVIPPMDQYSAQDGSPTAWHSMHYGHLALSGAGLLVVEATAVEPAGRISPYDLGLWDDTQEAAHKAMLQFIRQCGNAAPIAVQLGHSGRKGATARPWEGGGPLAPGQGGWEIYAPSPLPYAPDHQTPTALSAADLDRLTAAFAQAAHRAVRAGYNAIELHVAHGYLMHQFLSPLSNRRTDAYGGSLENRMRFPLAVLTAVRAAVPQGFPVGVRVSGTDFAPGGWDVEECAVFAQAVAQGGAAYIHVSGGGLTPEQHIDLAPGYQVGLAARVKAAVPGLPVIAVGLITEAELASSIVVTGQADMVAIGRGMLYDPRWPWHAAATLGQTLPGAPRQYLRSRPHNVKELFAD